MQTIDERIREALDADDAELYDKLAEPSMFGRAVEVLHGRVKWMNRIMWVTAVLIMGVGVYTLVRFFQAEEVRDMLIWGGGFMFAMTAVSMLKLWFWMEMQTNSVLREVKRVELQVARLASKAGD